MENLGSCLLSILSIFRSDTFTSFTCLSSCDMVSVMILVIFTFPPKVTITHACQAPCIHLDYFHAKPLKREWLTPWQSWENEDLECSSLALAALERGSSICIRQFALEALWGKDWRGRKDWRVGGLWWGWMSCACPSSTPSFWGQMYFAFRPSHFNGAENVHIWGSFATASPLCLPVAFCRALG